MQLKLSKNLFKSKGFKTLVNIIVFLICVLFLFLNIDFSRVYEQLKHVYLPIYGVTICISLFRTWLAGMRWKNMHPDHDSQLSNWSYFRLTMISHLFNKIMPGALGGDFVKTLYAIKEKKGSGIKNVIAVVIDRVIGLISIFIFGLIALMFSSQQLDIQLWKIILVFLFFTGCMYAAFNRRVLDFIEVISQKVNIKHVWIKSILDNWRQSISFYVENKGRVFKSLLLCVPIHFASFVIFFLFSRSIGMEVGFTDVIFVVTIMWLITALPISIGGMGVRELSFVWLFSLYNISSEQAIALSFLWYINTLVMSVISLPLLFDLKKRKKVLPESV